MENWKIGLDRYLTSGPPDDGFNDFCDLTVEEFSQKFYDENENWIIEETEQIDNWLNKLFSKGYSPKQTAQIIERAFYIHKIK